MERRTYLPRNNMQRRTSPRLMTLTSYANQLQNSGKKAQILRFLGQIDETGKRISTAHVTLAASKFGCSESDVKNALSMYNMAKQAETGSTNIRQGVAQQTQNGTAANYGGESSNSKKSQFRFFKRN